MEPYALFAHELAHTLFFDHFQNAAGLIYDHDHSDTNCAMSYPLIKIKGATAMSALTPEQEVALAAERSQLAARWPEARAVLAESDRAAARQKRVELGNIDRHVLSRVYRPHFCGKCNLKLRGWDIYAEHGAQDVLPLHSGAALPVAPPFVVSKPVKPPPPRKTTPTVRLVRGASGAAGEPALASIPISCFPSALTVAAGQPFPVSPVRKGDFKLDWLKQFPAGFGVDADALTDPAVFQVEVVDPDCGASLLYVTLEALLPTYGPTGPTGWQEFPGSERGRRSLQVECRAVPGEPTRFRSRYLRLVTDEADRAALGPTGQGLLVTDAADGKDGDADRVEILDQKVRASYSYGGPSAVTAEAKVGDPSRTRRRIKLFFHLYKHPSVDDPTLAEHARRRALRWVRRVYAQAEMSVSIVGVESLEWPAANMLTIHGFNPSTFTSNTPPTSGTDGTGPSKLTLTLTSSDGTTSATETVEVGLVKDLDAPALGRRVAEAIRGKGHGWSATAYVVPPSDQPLAPSCDVMITRTGHTVTIDAAKHDDTALREPWILQIPVPDRGQVDGEDNMVGGSPTQRRLLREGTSADDRIDVYVVPSMEIPGRAYPAYAVVREARFHPDAQVRRAALMAYSSGGKSAMDGGDDTPFTLAHEIGHVLIDGGHNAAQGELMAGSPCLLNRADAPKRIYSGPLKVGMEDPNQLDSTTQIFMNDVDMFARMSGADAANVTEDWPRT
jgi:hypothetical protein